VTDWLLIAAVGAVAAVDTSSFFQGMFHQPLVICTLLGAALGMPLEGAFYGALLQLIWLGQLPIGGTLHPDLGTAAAGLTGGALLLLVSGSTDLGLSGAVVALLAMPVAWNASLLVGLQQDRQIAFNRRAIASVDAGRPGNLRWLLLQGVLMSGVRGAVVAVATAGLSYLLIDLLGGLGLLGRISHYALLAGLLGVGLGVLFSLHDDREIVLWAGGGVALTALALALL